MLTLKQVKILHVMIFIAVLGFSVRLVGVANGLMNVVNTAQAEDRGSTHDEKPMEMAQKSGESSHGEDAGEKHDAEGSMEETVSDPIADQMIFEEEMEGGDDKWRDASDSDISYSNIRMEIYKDLAERREMLEGKEKALATREAMLRAAEKELDQKYQELFQLRGEIEQLLEKQSEEEQTRITSLVKIYEGMKAKEAARIFDTLDLDVLVSVMSHMSERKLSGILAAMNPERARTVTILLAEEKKLPQLPEN